MKEKVRMTLAEQRQADDAEISEVLEMSAELMKQLSDLRLVHNMTLTRIEIMFDVFSRTAGAAAEFLENLADRLDADEVGPVAVSTDRNETPAFDKCREHAKHLRAAMKMNEA